MARSPHAPPRPLARRSARAAVAVALAVATAAGAAACGDGGTAEPVTLSKAGRTGQQVAKDKGCASCHTTDGSRSTGPTWKDLAGSKVKLADGRTVAASDAYLARSITDSKAQVVAGFPAIMPSYDLSGAEVDALVAYLRDLAPDDDQGPGPG
jgi:cytochrome c oxidase subunit 2